MSNKVKAFWLGLFIVVAISLLIYLVTFLRPSVGDGLVRLKVHFSNIDKIFKGSLVTYAGRPIGEVVAITKVKNPQQALADAEGNLYVYELILDVDSAIAIYSYDEILFATSGLLGEKSIAIIPKATPPGAPAARNVTSEVLYARSSDRIEQTLNKLSHAVDTLECTLHDASSFIKTNNNDFNLALQSLTRATCHLESFLERACETDVVGKLAFASEHLACASSQVEQFFGAALQTELLERIGGSIDSLGLLTQNLSSGGGSFSRLINSDCAYVQLTTVLCQLRAILDDINRYGILYQFDRQWKRTHRRSYTEIPCKGYCDIKN
jgi:phospholipid/cholesterol/gamma-HCH transport system substrate-binding protein